MQWMPRKVKNGYVRGLSEEMTRKSALQRPWKRDAQISLCGKRSGLTPTCFCGPSPALVGVQASLHLWFEAAAGLGQWGRTVLGDPEWPSSYRLSLFFLLPQDLHEYWLWGLPIPPSKVSLAISDPTFQFFMDVFSSMSLNAVLILALKS